jgi:hypothetical protein
MVFGSIYLVAVAALVTCCRHDRQAWISVPIISAALGLVMLPLMGSALARWRRLSHDVTIFRHRWNGQPVLSIANQVPDAATAQAFLAELVSRIERVAPVETHGDGLVDQLALASELHTKGVLNAEEFASAKQRLIAGRSQEKRIGF